MNNLSRKWCSQIDADDILFRAGFDKSKLYEINLRTPFSAQPLFWKSAIEVSGDPAIGLHLGESMPIYKGQILEYLILSSSNFEEGLHRVLKYQRLISDALHASFIKNPEPHLVSHFSDYTNATSHLAEAMVVALIKLMRVSMKLFTLLGLANPAHFIGHLTVGKK